MTWDPFVDVKTTSADNPGRIEKVACALPSIPIEPGVGQAVAASPLVVVVLTSLQKAWYTERWPAGFRAHHAVGSLCRRRSQGRCHRQHRLEAEVRRPLRASPCS